VPPSPDRPAPKELAPARVNAKALVLIGIGLWLAALVVLGVLHLTGSVIDGRWPLICVAGLILGWVGFWLMHRIHLINDEGISE
jgi:hypothetical protein